MNKNGILKISEVALLFGIAWGSTFGLVKSADIYTDGLNRYNEMFSSDAITEYIQDDLDELNLQYGDFSDLDTEDFIEYRQAVKKIRENGASEVYGKEFDDAKRNMNVVGPITVALSATGILLSLGLFAAEAYLGSSTLTDVAKGVKDELSSSRYLSKIAKGLENLEDIKKDFILEKIYKFENRICFKVGEVASLKKTCFVYDIDSSKVNLKDEHAYDLRTYTDEIDKADKKYLLDIIKDNEPVFVGSQDEAYDYIYNQLHSQNTVEDTVEDAEEKE